MEAHFILHEVLAESLHKNKHFLALTVIIILMGYCMKERQKYNAMKANKLCETRKYLITTVIG
jgi:hypothetical protein